MFTHTTSFTDINDHVLAYVDTHRPGYTTSTFAQQQAFLASTAPADQAIKRTILTEAMADAYGIPLNTVYTIFANPQGHTATSTLGAHALAMVQMFELTLRGTGHDHVWLNEPCQYTLHTLQTVGNWDRSLPFDGHRETTLYTGRCARHLMHLVVNGRFSYSAISMLAALIEEERHTAGTDIIRRLIPHRYVANPDHGQTTPSGKLWSKTAQADGREDLLDALIRANYAMARAASQTIALDMERTRPHTVWLMTEPQDPYDPYDHAHHIVASDPYVLEQLRWRTLLEDIATYAQPPEDLTALIDHHRAQHEEALQAIYNAATPNTAATLLI